MARVCRATASCRGYGSLEARSAEILDIGIKWPISAHFLSGSELTDFGEGFYEAIG